MEAQKLLDAAPYGPEILKVLKQALDEACALEAIHKHQPQRSALMTAGADQGAKSNSLMDLADTPVFRPDEPVPARPVL
jgi:hypothetical protein